MSTLSHPHFYENQASSVFSVFLGTNDFRTIELLGNMKSNIRYVIYVIISHSKKMMQGKGTQRAPF